jgi:uncharacterized protein (UPF0548 family)
MKFVRRSDSAAMRRLVDEARQGQPTYSDIGATLVGGRPDGFHHDRYESVLGRGSEIFERAVNGLQTWKAHRVPGVCIFPEDEEIRTGVSVVVTLGTKLLALAAPCRIVSVIDEQNRWGFAYGTLPGHPEHGEEAFVVSISPDQSVRFEVLAFSRPADPIVRLSGPVGRGVQKGGTNGYLRALRRFVDQEPQITG